MRIIRKKLPQPSLREFFVGAKGLEPLTSSV